MVARSPAALRWSAGSKVLQERMREPRGGIGQVLGGQRFTVVASRRGGGGRALGGGVWSAGEAAVGWRRSGREGSYDIVEEGGA
jgi:hypothetical protein